MAKRVAIERPRVDVQLRPQAGISAQFVQPENPQTNRGAQVANALRGLIPELRQMAEEERRENEAAAELMLVEEAEKADPAKWQEFNSRFKNNSVFNNPLVNYKVRKAFGKTLEHEFGTFLQSEYNNNAALRDSADPMAVTGFIQSQKERFLKERGLDPDLMKAPGFMSGFMEGANQHISALTHNHINTAKQNKIRDVKLSFASEVQASVSTAAQILGPGNVTSMVPELVEEARQNLVTQLNQIQASYLALQGDGTQLMSGTEVNELMRETLGAAALHMKDPSILDLADKIKAGSGSLAGTAGFLEMKDKVTKAIRSELDQESYTKHMERERTKMTQTEAFSTKLYQFLSENPTANNAQVEALVKEELAAGGLLPEMELKNIMASVRGSISRQNAIDLTNDPGLIQEQIRVVSNMSDEQFRPHFLKIMKMYGFDAATQVKQLHSFFGPSSQNEGELSVKSLVNKTLSTSQQYVNSGIWADQKLDEALKPLVAQLHASESYRLYIGTPVGEKYADVVGEENVGKSIYQLPKSVLNAVAQKSADMIINQARENRGKTAQTIAGKDKAQPGEKARYETSAGRTVIHSLEQR